MYRRQALSALNEIPTNVDMLGALLLQEIHYKSTSSSVHGDPAFDKQRLIDAANNELTLPSPDRYYKYTTGGAVNQAIVIDEHQPPISEQKLVVQTIENGKNIPKSFSINSGSKDSNPDSHQPHYLRKPFLRQSSAQSSLLSVPMAKKKMENSYSNSQMALHLKNYGTFDSQLELQFFSENIPAIETVTRYLPMKGQTLSQTLMKHESIDENSVMMQSNSEKINSSKNNSSKNSSNSTLNAKCDDTPTTPKGDQGAFEGAFEGDHNQEMDSSGSSSYILLPAVTRRTTLIPAIGTGSDTILLTNSDDPLLAPQGDEMTPMGATLGVPSMGTSGSSGEGVNMTSSSTSSHVYLTPPKFLALACKKSTSDATCLVNSMVTNSTVFQAAVSPSVSSIGEGVGSVMVDATSISSFMSSSEGDAGTMVNYTHQKFLTWKLYLPVCEDSLPIFV